MMEPRRINEFITEYSDNLRVESTDETLTRRPKMWKVYQLEPVKGGIHPVHRSETTETEVWILKAEFPEPDGAHAFAQTIAGREGSALH
jgi:hypothetical protein